MNIHQRGFWLNNDYEGHMFDGALAEELWNVLKGYSVIDLGCGHGSYTMALKDHGIDCDGYDGNPNTPQLTNGVCGVLDLSQDIQLDKAYDYVLSLEVGEHIPAEYEQTFINNIHKLNTKGVILSWAIEGQGGDGHVNCHNNDYIRNIFEKLGYKPRLDIEQQLRAASRLSWFRNTIMVFER